MGIGRRQDIKTDNPDILNSANTCAPQWSAHSRHANWPLRLCLGLMLMAALILGLYDISTLTFTALTIITFCTVLMSFIRLLALCARPFISPVHTQTAGSPQSRKALVDPEIWPYYTVLVPLLQEAHMVPSLMGALMDLDYPATRLQILMICEETDPDTIRAVQRHLEAPFEIVTVPYSLPQTKPKALNVAMRQAIGDLITIYDAEDKPHPAQLKAAARALLSNPHLGAVQAPLRYYNANQNWLTRQFGLEYNALFHIWNPLLARLGLPFPLGGTSNHMRRTALDSVQRWDSYNVTEDADLSFRLAAFGWSIGTISPPTQEEAVSDYLNWRKQRERWLKGFMQSWIVHMRCARQGGFKRIFTLQITLGFTLLAAFLHVPTITACLILWAAHQLEWINVSPQPWVYASFLAGYLSALLMGILGTIRAGQPRLLLSVIAMPLYWMLLFWPAMRAIYQLCTRPFYWNKTRHGDTLEGLADPPTIF